MQRGLIHLPGAEVFGHRQLSRTWGQRAVGPLQSPGPSSEPQPRDWRHSQPVERDKAGKVLAGPNQGGAAPIAAQGPGLPVCLLQLFKLLQRARAGATFGKQLLISSNGVLSWRGLWRRGPPTRAPPPWDFSPPDSARPRTARGGSTVEAEGNAGTLAGSSQVPAPPPGSCSSLWPPSYPPTLAPP